MPMDKRGSFKGRQLTSAVILKALRSYLAFSISYRDLALMLSASRNSRLAATIPRRPESKKAMLLPRLLTARYR